MMSTSEELSDEATLAVPADLVWSAIRAARRRGQDVADVPLIALAREAGMSRSTLLRRIGGTRQALDAAVRAAGVDPGGRPTVRVRAVDAAARLISERGLAAATLEAVAETTGCSVHSLYAAFGGRDELLAAVYERHSPIPDLRDLLTPPRASLAETVQGVYQALASSLLREPRVAPAMLADLFSRPDGPIGQLFRRYFPAVLKLLGGWLDTEIRAGRVDALPVPLLVQQLIAPITVHLLLRPSMTGDLADELPDIGDSCAAFTDAFLRAVAPRGRPTSNPDTASSPSPWSPSTASTSTQSVQQQESEF